MPDREKVIKALQNCSVQNDVGCQQCPYFESRKAYGHEWCTTEMAQDALELLKEREAITIKKTKEPYGYGVYGGICPKCRNWIQSAHLFCGFCGQAVKWE